MRCSTKRSCVLLGMEHVWAGNYFADLGGFAVTEMFVFTTISPQVGDGTTGASFLDSRGYAYYARPTPVAVVGLDSGVASVTAGEVRLRMRGLCWH